MSRKKLNKIPKVATHWDALMESLAELASEHERSGWETFLLHPGDVAPVANREKDRPAEFRLVAPQSEVESLRDSLDRTDRYTEFTVRRAAVEGVALFAVNVRSPSTHSEVLFPLYYDPSVDTAFGQELAVAAELHVRITTLSADDPVLFELDDPELFSTAQ